MALGVEHPLPATRHIDIPSVAGFSMASAGFTALVVELAVRGWWGFATSGWEPLIILGWLGASGWLSWWAFTWADGWWKVLAFFGVVLSVLAALIIVAVFVLRMLVENPDLLDDNSKRRKSRKSGGRRGRKRRHY